MWYLSSVLCPIARSAAVLSALLASSAGAHQPGSGRLEPVRTGRLRYVHDAIGVRVLVPRGFSVEAHEKHSADVELQGPGGCTIKLQRLLPETESRFTRWTEWTAARTAREPGARELRVGGMPALQWRREVQTTLVGVGGPAGGHVVEIVAWCERPRHAGACRRAYDEVLRSASFL